MTDTRTLILLRHAQAIPEGKDDFDHARPLTDRGRREAAEMGVWLERLTLGIDAAVVSDARRTVETWEGAAARMAAAPSATFTRDLYDAAADRVLSVAMQAPGSVVLVVGHNPGIAALAHHLASPAPDHAAFERYPPGAALVVRVPEAGEAGTATLDFAVPGDLDS